jgi:tryptophan-rich sensory protein
LIAASSSSEVKGRAFGFHRAMDSLGAFLGASGAFVLFWFLGLGLRPILLIAAGIGFFALIPLVFVKEKIAQPQRRSLIIGLKGLPINFKRYLLAATVFALGNFTYMFFILKSKGVFEQLFSPRFATALPILLYVWFNIIYALFSIPAGIISDKIGRKKTIILGYALYSFTCLSFALANSLGQFILLFACYGLSFALIEGNQRAYASDFVADDSSGTALGTFHTCVSLAILPAGIIAGILWSFNPVLAFIYGALLAGSSIPLLARVE